MARTKTNPGTLPVGARKTAVKKTAHKTATTRRKRADTIDIKAQLRKPGRPKVDRRPQVVVQLVAEKLEGMTAGKLVEFLAEQHPSSTIEMHGTVDARPAIAFSTDRAGPGEVGSKDHKEAQDQQNRAMSDAVGSINAEQTKPVSRVEELLSRIERNTSFLHGAISTHEAVIKPCLTLQRDEEGGQLMQAEPGTDSGQLVIALEHHNAVLSAAILRIEALTARVQL